MQYVNSDEQPSARYTRRVSSSARWAIKAAVASRSRWARCFTRASSSVLESCATAESRFESIADVYHGDFAPLRKAPSAVQVAQALFRSAFWPKDRAQAAWRA